MTPQVADYFCVPLLDGRFGLGQVFETAELETDGALFCGLTARIATPAQTPSPLTLADIIAFCRLAPEQIENGTWPLAGFDQIPRYGTAFDYAGNRVLGFPDHPIHDPAVIEAFLSAFHGLYPWDGFGPLFDDILRAGVPRPGAA